MIAYAVETLRDATLKAVRKTVKDLHLVLTHARARTLKIRLYTSDVVALPLDAKATAEGLRAIADPTFDMTEPMKGPFEAERAKLPTGFAAAIKLAKLSGLLPAVVAVRVSKAGKAIASVEAKDI
ncbi:MAG: GTP cyclohydrolase II, partial [Rhizomicrobium sp.]